MVIHFKGKTFLLHGRFSNRSLKFLITQHIYLYIRTHNAGTSTARNRWVFVLAILLFISASFSMIGKSHFEGKNSLHNTSRKENCSACHRPWVMLSLKELLHQQLSLSCAVCISWLLRVQCQACVRYCCILSQTCTCCEADSALKHCICCSGNMCLTPAQLEMGNKHHSLSSEDKLHHTSGPGDIHHLQEP